MHLRADTRLLAQPTTDTQLWRAITAEHSARLRLSVATFHGEYRQSEPKAFLLNDRICYVLEGNGTIESEGRSVALQSNDAVIIPAGIMTIVRGDMTLLFADGVELHAETSGSEQPSLGHRITHSIKIMRSTEVPLIKTGTAMHILEYTSGESAQVSLVGGIVRGDYRFSGPHVVNEHSDKAYYVKSGTGHFYLADTVYPLQPQDIVLIPVGTAHGIQGELDVLIICGPAFDRATEQVRAYP